MFASCALVPEDLLYMYCVCRWTAANHAVAGGIEIKGILISSHVPLSVNLAQIDLFYPKYQSNQLLFDATLVPPVSSVSTSFVIANHVSLRQFCSPANRYDFIAIASSVDNTSVTVTPPMSSTSSFVLNRLETYSDDANSLSGTKIDSSAPITVVSGTLCTANNVGDSLAFGTYISSERPVAKYSTQYVVPAIKAPQNSGYDVHVVASADGTIANIQGQDTEIDENEIFVQAFAFKTNSTLVTCSLPCNVKQFTKGYANSDGNFAINVIPSNEFYTRATFNTLEENMDHHITLVVDSSTPVSDVLLDGVLFDPVWSTVGDFIYATADVDEGYHVITSTESLFAVYTYGHSGILAGGYGYEVLSTGMCFKSSTYISLFCIVCIYVFMEYFITSTWNGFLIPYIVN